ncbi:MAG: hypothetical protein JSR61_13090 [Proteobacteria bacterium]|nr:hypothetical protein [Pseudomonadota bacterium]
MHFSKEETCKYLRDTSAQLALLSADSGLFALAYILSMAQMEAASNLAEIQGVPLLGIPHVPNGDGVQANEKLMAFAT